MKFFVIVSIIYFYIISQTIIDARTTGLKKIYWHLPTNGNYHDDLLRQKLDEKRQAGWGKRRNLITEDEYNELPPYHPYAPHENLAHTWFDDK